MRIFSEFKAAVGTVIGAHDWIEVTHERINLFAQAPVNYHMVIEIEGGERPACH